MKSSRLGHEQGHQVLLPRFQLAATGRRGRPFAKPGNWNGADPAAQVAWYQTIGANVIQTFCVATNGYAWYQNGFVPEQPGLKHDFLPEVVKLGHQEGMQVMGYFCISSNPRWGGEHPDLSYGTPTTCHIPSTDEYLDFLSKSISDALRKTGIDGFMIDWLMNEAGSLDAIRIIEGMIGDHARLITCMALWNGQDASKAVPEALAAGVGLYGFTAPKTNDGLVPLDKIFSRQVSELSGDDKNIAVLARAYQGKSSYALWPDGKFVEPENPPPFRLSLQGRGRGAQDTATITHDGKETSILITTPYGKGRGQLFLTGKSWPSSLVTRLQNKPGVVATSTVFRIANNEYGLSTSLDGSNEVSCGQVKKGLKLDRPFGEDFLSEVKDKVNVGVKKAADFIGIVVPPEITKGNPDGIACEWN